MSVGATTGRAAIVENYPPFAIVRSALLLKPVIPARFLLYWTQSSWAFQWMTQASGASAQPHLYIHDIRRMPVPLPPQEEQEEIIRRVNALMEVAEKLDGRYRRAQAHMSKINQAILSKAFRGELVPTEAELANAEGRTYETAAQLLERIKKQQDGQSTRRMAPANNGRARRRA